MERYHLFAYPPASAAGTFGFGLIFGFVLDSIAKIPWAWLNFLFVASYLFWWEYEVGNAVRWE